MHRPADLREILRYVPLYRDKCFVVAVDGAIVDHANFRNLLLDVAVMGSLRIGVMLVHGAGRQIERLGSQLGVAPSNLDGVGVTDEPTLELARLASGRITQRVFEVMAGAGLRGASTNAVAARATGILNGVDQQFTGRVDRVDKQLIQSLLAQGCVPVISSVAVDREGQSYRLNSDAVAVEVAAAMNAAKVIFVTTEPGVRVLDEDDQPRLIRQMSAADAEALFETRRDDIMPSMLSKLRHAVDAAERSVPRVHIIDGGVDEGLLTEVFSPEGVGTLIHADEYQSIRPATKNDAPALHSLMKSGMENDELLQRPLSVIEEHIDDYFVFEADQLILGCAAVRMYPEASMAELGSVCVHPACTQRGIGKRLIKYAEKVAKERGAAKLYCLSTQAYQYFRDKGGFDFGSPGDLPAERRTSYDASDRRSKVLIKAVR